MGLLTEKYKAWAKYPEKYTTKQVLDQIIEDLEWLDKEDQILEQANLKFIEDEHRQSLKEQSILKQVMEKVSEGAYKEILEELKEASYTFNYQIVDKPIGKMRELDEYEFIKGVYVNQTTNGGYTGDEFAGTCSIEIGKNEFFQFSYSM